MMVPCARNRRRMALAVAVALLLMAVGGILLLMAKVEPSHGSGGRSPLFILVPVYTALIPVYLAAWRRRNKHDV